MDEKQLRKNLAYHLKVERIKKNITQENLAELAQLSEKHVTKIESSNVTPSIYLVYKMANALNVSVDKLISDIDD